MGQPVQIWGDRIRWYPRCLIIYEVIVWEVEIEGMPPPELNKKALPTWFELECVDDRAALADGERVDERLAAEVVVDEGDRHADLGQAQPQRHVLRPACSVEVPVVVSE